jgi:hypothetical protein
MREVNRTSGLTKALTSFSRKTLQHGVCQSVAWRWRKHTVTPAIRWATQWPATARLQGLAEPCRRDTKWLGDSHCNKAVALPASGWYTALWLDHWSHTESYKSVHVRHSSASY